MSSQIQPAHVAAEPFTRQLAWWAVVAGIIGGILVDLFLILVHSAPFPTVYQFIASTIVGKEAFASSSYIWLGMAIHLAISVGWALVYAYVANAMHALSRWVISGIVLGIVVMIVMEIITIAAGVEQPITVASGIVKVIAHVLFFGWPIAWYLSRGTRRPVTATAG